jgi:hypothetical protein
LTTVKKDPTSLIEVKTMTDVSKQCFGFSAVGVIANLTCGRRRGGRLEADIPDVSVGWFQDLAVIERGRHESGGYFKGR